MKGKWKEEGGGRSDAVRGQAKHLSAFNHNNGHVGTTCARRIVLVSMSLSRSVDMSRIFWGESKGALMKKPTACPVPTKKSAIPPPPPLLDAPPLLR